ncbi:MAG: LPXTG cell wall anchor domain-containing protein [Bacilli bacterium]
MKTGSSPVMVIIILTVIVLAGIGGFVFYKRKAK